MRTTEGRRYLEDMRYRPPQHYTDGLVVAGDQPSLVGVPLGQPLAFDTNSHRVCRLDDILGDGWAVVGVDLTDDDWTGLDGLRRTFAPVTAAVVTADVLPASGHRVLLDVDGALKRELGSYTGRFVLLRPDRFVAAAWRPPITADIVAELSRWSRRAVTTVAAP